VSADPAPLFVYGSLLFPEVVRALIDRDPARSPATVCGWRVVSLPGRTYPGLARSPVATADGELLTDLGPTEWHTLDAFEADVYTLDRVDLVDGGHAWAYACADRADVFPACPWQLDDFARDHLTGYLDRCARWRHHYNQTR
jgi:gamma-glutamylcyclotransferase (GGCT)/AIG2-like uncharacterized protein YtfP